GVARHRAVMGKTGTLSRESPRLCRAPDGKRPSACGGRAIYRAGARERAQAGRGDEGAGGLHPRPGGGDGGPPPQPKRRPEAAAARKHGGALTVADLAEHKADWVEPLAQDYRGYTLHEIPPNGQGIAAQMALGILEGFDLAALPVDSADSLHLQIEAVKLAFA